MNESATPPITLRDLLAALECTSQPRERPTGEWKAAAKEFSDHSMERRGEFLELFDGREPAAVEFYERLRCVANETWGSDEAQQLAGTLWGLALHDKNDVEQSAFLDAWFGSGWSLFGFLRAMPYLVEKTRLTSAVAEPWFLKVYERVKNDGANGPFFTALTRYACHWPDEALLILESNRSRSLTNGETTLLGNLLAGLHHITLTPENAKRRDQTELSLSASREVSHRTAVHLARRCRVAAGLATETDVASWFADLAREPSDLRIEGFRLAWVAATRPVTDSALLPRALGWLEQHTGDPLNDEEKHQLLNIVSPLLAPQNRQRSVDRAPLHKLLQKLLPLPQGESGLWSSIDYFFRTLIENAPAELAPVLRILASDPGGGLVEVLRHRDGVTALRDALHTPDGMTLIAKFCFSLREGERELGLVLFENSGMTAFPASQLAGLDERIVLLSLYQFQRMPFTTEVVSRYLLALLPRVQTCAKEIQQEYYEELLYQAKNLPNACLALLREHPEPPERLRKVIAAADEYFDRLRACVDAPITQMAVPALRGALRIQSRRFNEAMSEGFRRGSVFAQLCHNVRVIYGQTFSSYQEGIVSNPTPMQEFRHEIEMPRILLMDPEASAMRRLTASVRIRALEARHEGTP